MPKAESAFSRKAEIYETSLGWRFINPSMQAMYGTDSMGETAENVAADFNIARQDQDAFALRSPSSAPRRHRVDALQRKFQQFVFPSAQG